MKKQSMMYATRAYLAMASFLFLFNSVQAADQPADSAVAVKIKYEGANESLLTFSVGYQNPEGKNFVLEVRNEQSEVLFRHSYNTKEFNKKIYFLKSQEKGIVSFAIRSGKASVEETFEIRPEVKIVDDLLVKRL